MDTQWGVYLTCETSALVHFSLKTECLFKNLLIRLIAIELANMLKYNFFLIVTPCILTTLMFLSPTNALLYYTYNMLKYTVKISHMCTV